MIHVNTFYSTSGTHEDTCQLELSVTSPTVGHSWPPYVYTSCILWPVSTLNPSGLTLSLAPAIVTSLPSPIVSQFSCLLASSLSDCQLPKASQHCPRHQVDTWHTLSRQGQGSAYKDGAPQSRWPYLCDHTACGPDVLRGLLVMVELRLPLVNWLVREGQKDAPLVHQSRTDAACPNIHTHVAAPWFLISTRHDVPFTCSGQRQKPHGGQAGLQSQAQDLLKVEIKGVQLTGDLLLFIHPTKRMSANRHELGGGWTGQAWPQTWNFHFGKGVRH